MLCSEKELGISEAQGGIMELSADLVSGRDLVEALELADTMIEVDLTPNRADCASVIGIAREAGSFVGRQLTTPVPRVLPALAHDNLPFAIKVDSAEDCPRYAARLLRGVTVGPSPWWLRRRLLAVGQRPINNVVDITNFVMLEYGQPLHAFDFTRLAGSRLEVRRARAGEQLQTLDGVTRDLNPEMLLICDAEKPVAVAGVMGGANSEVNPVTSEVLLESACFNPVSVRRTSRVLGLGTEASYRFERGVDPLLAPQAMERAVRLLCEITGATAVAGGVDFCEGVKPQPTIALRVVRTNDLLGLNLDADAIVHHLAAIEIPAVKRDDEIVDVTPPSFRIDLEREIDLVEEVARLVGYNDIPTSLPMVPMSFPEQDAARLLRQRLAFIMTAMGFYEAINYSFVGARHCDMLCLAEGHAARACVPLLNPLGEEQAVMRTLLLPGLLENVRRNINFQTTDVRLFEIGKVFHPLGDAQPHEKLHLTAVLTGCRQPMAPVVHFGAPLVDIFDAKGVVEAILESCRLSQVTFVPAVDGEIAEPDQFIRLMADGKEVGQCGQLSLKVAKGFGIKQPLFYIDIDLEALVALTPAATRCEPLARFPAVRWDLAVVVGEEVRAGDLVAAIDAAAEPLVEKVELFDIYRGKPMEKGQKSVALSLTYRSNERTLDDETVGAVHTRLTDLLLTRFQARLREV
jgi:phenylalanyl-tRNA synthetase beta chain